MARIVPRHVPLRWSVSLPGQAPHRPKDGEEAYATIESYPIKFRNRTDKRPQYMLIVEKLNFTENVYKSNIIPNVVLERKLQSSELTYLVNPMSQLLVV